MRHPVTVLIHNDSARQSAEWVEALASSQVRAENRSQWDPEELPVYRIDVLLNAYGTPASLGPFADRLSSGTVGLVAVGGQGPADVLLPTNASTREIRLVCRLLADVVRLRRTLERERRRGVMWQQLAASDPLTGVKNRRAFDTEVRRICRDCAGQMAAWILMDLDRFRDINRNHGMAVGDEHIRLWAHHLQEILPDNAELFRWGGDEFLVILPNCDEHDAAAQLIELSGRLAAADLGPTASLGCCVDAIPGDASDVATRLERADAAMRQVKAAGGGSYRLWSRPTESTPSGGELDG